MGSFIAKLFCRHNWEILSEVTTKSKHEHALEALKNFGPTRVKLPWQLCDGERKHIQTLTCTKCGRLKRYVETI